jgi:hypothetical protein
LHTYGTDLPEWFGIQTQGQQAKCEGENQDYILLHVSSLFDYDKLADFDFIIIAIFDAK